MDRNQEMWATIGDFVGTAGLAATLFGGPQGALLGRVLAAGSSLIAQGVAATSAFQALTAEVQAMVDAGVDPTPDQWNTLFQRHQDAAARIAASKPQAQDVPPVLVVPPVSIDLTQTHDAAPPGSPPDPGA